ncbi:unnamed protein product [Linum tenue]|uniref:Pentatricopeptide repeat-containing protein n=1 Tax=Linum tenue TaxID=586396 RepID=A0AAV0L4B1_9ROSI|nr:unnamed protein product [Linum tenue]
MAQAHTICRIIGLGIPVQQTSENAKTLRLRFAVVLLQAYISILRSRVTVRTSPSLKFNSSRRKMIVNNCIIHRNCSPFLWHRKVGTTVLPYSSSASSAAPLSSYFASNPTPTTTRTSNSATLASVDDAMDSFNRMLCMNPRPSIVKFGQLLSSLLRVNAFQAALYVSKQMELVGIPHDLYTLSMLIRCFCKLGRVDFAYSVLSKALKLGLQFDAVIFSTLIDGLCKFGKVVEAARQGHVDEALALFQAIESSRLKPDVVMYNILMDGLWTTGRAEEAKDMFSRLSKDDSLRPDTRTYNIVIDGLCRQGFVDEAYGLFRNTEGGSCPPDSCSYNVMIQGYLRRKDPLEAFDLIQEMVSKGFSADASTMSLLIEKLPKDQLDHLIVQKLLNGPDIKNREIGSNGLSTSVWERRDAEFTRLLAVISRKSRSSNTAATTPPPHAAAAPPVPDEKAEQPSMEELMEADLPATKDKSAPLPLAETTTMLQPAAVEDGEPDAKLTNQQQLLPPTSAMTLDHLTATPSPLSTKANSRSTTELAVAVISTAMLELKPIITTTVGLVGTVTPSMAARAEKKRNITVEAKGEGDCVATEDENLAGDVEKGPTLASFANWRYRRKKRRADEERGAEKQSKEAPSPSATPGMELRATKETGSHPNSRRVACSPSGKKSARELAVD